MIRMDRTKVIGKRGYYNFRCKCGNIVEKRGDTKAEYCCKPGCEFSKVKRHGKGNKANKLYRRWEGIRGRCHGNHKDSKTYKDKGIKMCDEWLHDFLKFEKWALANGYDDSLDIDRIDINGDYSPENCEFVTRAENTRRQNRDNHGPYQTRKGVPK